MRISRLEHAKAVAQIRDLAEGQRRRGLIDGGATACLRTAKASEKNLPKLSVELACGSCELHVNAAGTLLSPRPVTPIVSVSALLELGFRIHWTKESCVVNHHTKGRLPVDATSGCPEIDREVALQLISEYEQHVRTKDMHEARVRCVLTDMSQASTEDLALSMWSGGVEAAAALRLLTLRLFPSVPPELCKQVPPSLTQTDTDGGWNRRARRRAEKSGGVLVHFSDEGSKRAFQEVADRCDWEVLHIDHAGAVMPEAKYSFLLQLAQKGLIRGVIGSPPFRSFSGFQYLTRDGGEAEDLGTPESAVRIRGQSLGSLEGLTLSGPNAAMRLCDDRFVLRMMLVFAVASVVNRHLGLPIPAFVLEQPEDKPPEKAPSLWATPEWSEFAVKFDMDCLSFDQGPLLHQQCRPTTLASNMVFPSGLVDCRGPGVEGIPGIKKASR